MFATPEERLYMDTGAWKSLSMIHFAEFILNRNPKICPPVFRDALQKKIEEASGGDARVMKKLQSLYRDSEPWTERIKDRLYQIGWKSKKWVLAFEIGHYTVFHEGTVILSADSLFEAFVQGFIHAFYHGQDFSSYEIRDSKVK